MENDVSSNKAPKAGPSLDRGAELERQRMDTTTPAPEVEGAATSVPRKELVSDLPAKRKDVTPWKPIGRGGKPKSIE